jgi:hypothetical protein
MVKLDGKKGTVCSIDEQAVPFCPPAIFMRPVEHRQQRIGRQKEVLFSTKADRVPQRRNRPVV